MDNTSNSYVSPTISSTEQESRRKHNFKTLNIPKHLCLGYVVDWAQEDCEDDHKLIANCLDFLDEEARVNILT